MLSEGPRKGGWMGCDKGAVEKTNRKVNTRTSLFLFRLLAEQLSPKSQLPPEFYPPIFSARRRWWWWGGEWEAREEETEREKKEDSRTCAWLCVCLRPQAHPQKEHGHTHSYTHTCAAAAIAVATADPSAVRYEK